MSFLVTVLDIVVAQFCGRLKRVVLVRHLDSARVLDRRGLLGRGLSGVAQVLHQQCLQLRM